MLNIMFSYNYDQGRVVALRLSVGLTDSRGPGFGHHWGRRVVSLSKTHLLTTELNQTK